MTEIIPSINAATFVGVQKRITKVEPYVSWCHLDVTDGVFSKHQTWNDPRDLASLMTTLSVEVHLMIEGPEEILGQWLVEPIRRVIAHLEACLDPQRVIQRCHEVGKEIGFAINPETPWTAFEPWFGKADIFLPLGVPPGASGQKPDWDLILGKIAAIREACPSCIIEADGGINKETASRARDAGANFLVAGSAIFDASNVAAAIQRLQERS